MCNHTKELQITGTDDYDKSLAYVEVKPSVDGGGSIAPFPVFGGFAALFRRRLTVRT